MAFSINRVTLLGRVSQDPELRYTAKGHPVCTVNLATSYSYREGEEWKEVPNFSRCVIWGKPAEIVSQKIKKGEYLYVDGRIQTRKWETQEGQTRYSTEVIVRNFVIPQNQGGKLTVNKTENEGEGLKDLELPAETNQEDDMPF